MMRKGMFFAVAACLLSVLLLSEARTESLPDQWAFGFRIGPGFLFEEDSVATAGAETLQGETGINLNVIATYRVNDFLALGVGVEREQHRIQGSGANWGQTSTFTVLPRGEFYLGSGTPFSPYLIFGVGYNFNFFSEDSGLATTVSADSRVDLDNSYTFVSGIGADMFFLSDRFSLNLEIKVKHNRAHLKVISGAGLEGLLDFKGHSFSILFGFRYHFPSDPFF